MDATAATSTTDPLPRVAQFLFEEARLLDNDRFAEWLDLFTDDGVYWVPSRRGQTDPLDVPSIIFEDRRLLAMRIGRLAHPRALLTTPMPRMTRMIGNVSITAVAGSGWDYEVTSIMIAAEYHDERQRVFSGACTHRLRCVDQQFRMSFKRVDLVNCDAVHSAMMLPF